MITGLNHAGTNAHTATNDLIHEKQLKANAATAELLQNRLDRCQSRR